MTQYVLAEGPLSKERDRPISASIVLVNGKSAPEGYAGDVMVTFVDGHKEMWTTKGGCELPKVSKTGLVGWTRGTAFHSNHALMNDTLVIVQGPKRITRMKAAHPSIDLWDFTDGNACAVVRSGNAHGPLWLEKFSLGTGQLLDQCSGSQDAANMPAWARPYAD